MVQISPKYFYSPSPKKTRDIQLVPNLWNTSFHQHVKISRDPYLMLTLFNLSPNIYQKWKWYPNISIFFSLENGGKRQNYLIQLFNGDRPIHTHTPSLIICLSFTQTFETWTERRHWRNQLWLKQLRNTLAEAQSMGLVTSLTEGLELWIVFFGCSWSLPFWALLLPWHGTSGRSGETNR